jgi:phage tail sheath gpL-like
MLLRHRLRYAAFKLKGDELLSDGTVNPNQKLRRGVITPFTYKPFVKGLLTEFDDASKLQETASSKEGLDVRRDPNNNGRLEVGLDLHVIDLLHQATFRVAEVSTS